MPTYIYDPFFRTVLAYSLLTSVLILVLCVATVKGSRLVNIVANVIAVLTIAYVVHRLLIP